MLKEVLAFPWKCEVQCSKMPCFLAQMVTAGEDHQKIIEKVGEMSKFAKTILHMQV